MPAARGRLSPERARAEIERRTAAAVGRMTALAISAGHRHQLEILTTTALAIVLMCSRRAGKSIACVALCILTALKTANVRCLYLSLTADQSAPRYDECKAMLDRFGIPYTPSESDQVVELFNGSRIRFTGIDDKRRATVFKGDQLAGGVAIVDEAQDDPGLLEWLLKDVLDNMVNEVTAEKPTPGRIVVAGVVPESAAGYFWKLWTENHDEETDTDKPDAAWKCMAWGRADNPHEHNFRALLDAHLARFKLEESDPIIQRNWYGRRVFDSNVTAYRYSAARNTWTPTPAPWLGEFKLPKNHAGAELGRLLAAVPPPGVDTFAAGIDPASRRDCCVIQVVGWGPASPDVWHVAEFATAAASGIRQDQWIDVLLQLRARFNILRQLRDAGSAAEDIMLADYKVRIEAVKKWPGSVKDRVDRSAALLGQGLYHAMAGSELEAQLKTVRWDPAAREKGKWVLLASIPNDASDGGDYALVPYFDATEPEVKPETYEQHQERLFREAMNPPVKWGPEEDPALTQLLGD